jgi:hypothetical protein
MPNAHSRLIYVGDCFYASVATGIKTSAGINVGLAMIVMHADTSILPF